jgi:hypothetical protein
MRSSQAHPSPPHTAADDQQQFPSLAISDLLVLTLCVGFALACIAPGVRDSLALPVEELRIPKWRLVIPEITDYLTFGMALFGLIVLARQRIRGSIGLTAPGHWIFVAIGPFAFLRLVTGAWHDVLAAYWFEKSPVLLSTILDVLFGITLVLSLLLLLRGVRTLEPRWRLCLALIVVWLLFGCAWCAFELAQSRGIFRRELIVGFATTYLLAFVAACAAGAIDALKGIRRDWLHYLAIVLLALYAVSNALHHGDLVIKWWHGVLLRLLP